MNKDFLEFYRKIYKLKTIVRRGWKTKNLQVPRLESVAEHITSTTLLAIAIIDKKKLKLNLGKVLKMIAIHELGEIYVGDITPFDNITKTEKYKKELAGIKTIAKILDDNSLIELWKEFEEKKTPEAIFVKKVDKYDSVLQAKIYSEITKDGNKLFNEFKTNLFSIYSDLDE